MTGRPDIVMICLDSVRKDFFDEAAVRTGELADVSFDQCRAASSWSSPSHASMFSGRLPHEHGVHAHSKSFTSLQTEDTVLGELDGYRTVGISANAYAGPAYDFDVYFDEFYELDRVRKHPEALDPRRFTSSNGGLRSYVTYLKECLSHPQTIKSLQNGAVGFADSALPGDLLSLVTDSGAKKGLELARRALKGDDEPTFVFLNLMETHIPYRPALYLDSGRYECPWNWSSAEKGVWELCTEAYDERYWEWRNQLYLAHIDYLDRRTADFVERVSDDTSIVITADHGDNLGTSVDSGLANHKSSLSEGVLHVPLLVCNAPDDVASFEARYVSHLRLPNLLKGLRDRAVPDLSEDRIHAEVVGMSPGPDPDENHEYWNRMIRCAYRGSKKVVWDSLGEASRFALNKERLNWQSHEGDLSEVPAWARSAFAEDIRSYKAAAKRARGGDDIDDATEARLKELGYL